mmetsp:Transcript_32505/g.100601  ORF Transcript_32505/g.100601 Transcript_32505/m.100601 type:complete len:305 (-) Transcript_32505:26-940(-)
MTGRQTPLNSKLVSRAHRGPSTRATLKEFGAVARRVATMLRARGAARSSSASERFIGGGPGARAALDHHVERRARNMTRVPCRGTAGGSRGPRDAFLVEREPSTRRRTRAAATASSDAWSTRAVSDADCCRDVMPNARARTTDAPTGRRDSLRARSTTRRCATTPATSSRPWSTATARRTSPTPWSMASATTRTRSRTARRSRGTRTSATDTTGCATRTSCPCRRPSRRSTRRSTRTASSGRTSPRTCRSSSTSTKATTTRRSSRRPTRPRRERAPPPPAPPARPRRGRAPRAIELPAPSPRIA